MPQTDLDWTFDDIPGGPGDGPGSPAGPGRARRPSRRRLPAWLTARNRRLWATLATGLLVVGLAGFAVFRVGWERLRAQIQHEVRYEDEQSVAGSAAAVRAVQAAGYPLWAARRAAEAGLGWPATPPTAHLLPTAVPGRVSRVRALEPGLVEATVVRALADSAGGVYEFDYLQRYASPQPGIWQRLPPLAGEAVVVWLGQRLSVTLPAGDSSWLLPLLAQVDDILVRACADWACTGESAVALVLVEDVSQLPAPVGGQHARPDAVPGAAGARPESSPGYPVVLSEPYTLMRDWRRPLRLPGPALGGRPHDEAAAAALMRGYAGQALTELAARLAGVTRRPAHVYLDALVAREELRLGVSPAPSWPNSPLAYVTPQLLWPGTRYAEPAAGSRPDPALGLQALAFLDFALAGQPAALDAQLLQSLASAPNLAAWLDGRLPAAGAEVIAAWEAQVAGQLGASSPPDWASLAGLTYSCGEQLYVVGAQGPQPVDTRGPVVWLMNGGRSPDGRYLAALVESDDEHRAELHLVSLTGEHTLFVAQDGWPAGWTSTGELVYLLPAETPGQADFGYNLYRFDPASMSHWLMTPEPVVPEWRPDLAWSADHQLLAVTLLQETDTDSPRTSPALVSFEPGPRVIKLATHGHSASISPDGRRLAFVEGSLPWLTGAQGPLAEPSTLSVLDLESRTLRSILPAAASPDTDFHTLTGLTWSPDGQRLSFIDYGPGEVGRLLIARFAGQGSEQAELSAHPLADSFSFYYYDFSADGRYLAAWGQANGYEKVVVLDLDPGAPQPGLTTTNLGAWSPNGQWLAVPGHAGLYAIDPETRATQWVAPGECVVGWYAAP